MSFHALRSRAGTPMSLFGRIFRRSVCCLLGVVSGVCAAQQQFTHQPEVELTEGRVTSIQAGTFQSPPAGVDVLYINAPTVTAGVSTVNVGALLNSPQSFKTPGNDIIPFTNVSNVVAALGDFNSDGILDFAFALTPSGSNTTNLCVYYGTGATASQTSSNGVTSYDGGNFYTPRGIKNGCATFAVHAGGIPPNFAYIAAPPFTTHGVSQLVIEDSANKYLYVIQNNGGTGSTLPGFVVKQPILSLADGAGPIYYGDLNGDGNTDLVINGQTNYTATVYLGNGDGTFKPPVTYAFGGQVRSMQLQDMDLDGRLDMVVEGTNGVLSIHKGIGDGTFAANTIGSFPAGMDGFSGNGGHLVAVDPNNLNILTATPIGLSVLQNGGTGSLNYTLKGIYDIGPGRSSYALALFYTTPSFLDLAVDSPEGVAFIQGDANGDGGFNTPMAYSAMAPALGAVEGQFRTGANNPNGYLDVIAATDATKAQLLTGNGLGVFTTYGSPTNTQASPNVKLWSNILTGDFNGDGVPDIAYSLTGLPLPTSGSGLYVQYGNGDGTFQAPAAVNAGQPGSNTFFGESVAGIFNNTNSISGIANIDAHYDDVLRGQLSGGFNLGLNAAVSNAAFSQVAAGFFAPGRTSQQDLVFQQGATTLVPYKNALDGTGRNFAAQTPLTVSLSTTNFAVSAVLLTDIDGDGKGDILALYHNLNSVPSDPVASAPNWLYIWYGNGDGTFQPAVPLQLNRNYYLAGVADLDVDGKPDIVLSDGYLVSVLYSSGSRNFVTDFGTQCTPCYEQHFLAGQGINSISLQSLRGSRTPDLVVANGGTTISNPLVLAGASMSSASLAANADVNTGGITVMLNNISTYPVTGTLSSTPNPSGLGASFTITATLLPATGVAVPTGTVTFYIDGTTPVGCAYVPLSVGASSSTAQCVIPQGNTYTAGTHPVTAYYAGDGNNSPYTFSAYSQNIQSVTTTTTLYICIGPTLACPSTGSVTVPPPPFPTALTMYYGQDWNGITQATANDNSALTGTIALNDAYTGPATPPVNPLCTLQAGVLGTCPASIGTTVGTSVGTNVLTSVYSGDSAHSGSTSPSVTITVLPDTTTATLTGSPNPSPQGQSVTFTATLTGNYAPPTGPVAFMYGSTVLCAAANLIPSATGVTSTATCLTSTLPVGADLITATYAATTDFNTATPATTTETITSTNTNDFTIATTPNPVSVGVGYAALLTVTVTAQNGFAEGVTLSCGNLPTEATCIFTPAAVPSGGGITTLIVETTAPHNCGETQPYFLGGNGGGPGLAPLALPALAGLLMIFIPGKRRWLRALVAVVVVAGATQMTGCGNCTDLGTKPATYTFQVIGTSTGTGEVQSQAVTLSITI